MAQPPHRGEEGPGRHPAPHCRRLPLVLARLDRQAQPRPDCCESYPSRRVIQASREALRAALTHAVAEEEINKNVASPVKVPKPRRRRVKPWSVTEAGELYADHQIQRAGRQILHRETKTEDSGDFLPLPALCPKALRMRRAQQLGDRKASGPSRCGTPVTRAAHSWSPFGCTRKWHSESCATRRSP